MEIATYWFLLMVTVVSAQQSACPYKIHSLLRHRVLNSKQSNTTEALEAVLSDYLGKTGLPETTEVLIAQDLNKLYLIAVDELLSTIGEFYVYSEPLGGRGERANNAITMANLKELYLTAGSMESHTKDGISSRTFYILPSQQGTRLNVVKVFADNIDKCYGFVLIKQGDNMTSRRFKREAPIRSFNGLLNWYKQNKNYIKCGDVLKMWKQLRNKDVSRKYSQRYIRV